MRILLDKIGKRFNDEWVFRKLDLEIVPARHCVVLGPNGSGKSTLLNIISSRVTPDEGNIIFENEGRIIDIENAYKFISICSPYIELIEAFTLVENIQFFTSFKKIKNNLSVKELVEVIDLKNVRNKKLSQFSSGMKQRVKLALAIFADTRLTLLDEPCMGLDAEGIQWYNRIISFTSSDETVIVGSNSQPHEYSFCSYQMNISDYKK